MMTILTFQVTILTSLETKQTIKCQSVVCFSVNLEFIQMLSHLEKQQQKNIG